MRLRATALALTALAAAPVAAQDVNTERLAVPIYLADGTAAGNATFFQTENGLVVEARLDNLPEGAHGFHIHETGSCAPDFGAAGGHYNPAGAEHGYQNAEGHHAGDLPNVHVSADGTAAADFHVPWLVMDGSGKDAAPYPLNDEDGSAVMIHAQADDYAAEPPGSSGDRIACGVIYEARS